MNKMKFIFRNIALLNILLMLCVPLAFGRAVETINISVGESREVNTGFVITKIATGDPSVCVATRVSEMELLINAQRAGRTNIIVWGQAGEKKEIIVNVGMLDADNSATEIKELLKDIEGVRVRVVGQKIAVEGEVFTKRDYEKVNKVLLDVPNVINLVEISPIMRNIISEEMEKAIGMEGITVKAGKTKYILEGRVGNKEAAQRAEKIAFAYSPDIINAIEVVAEGIIYSKVQMIEVSLNVMAIKKSALRDMGIHWNPGGTGGDTSSFISSLTGTIGSLFPKSKKIIEDGNGRMLMQQSVITKSNGNANFFVGSEIPIPIARDGGSVSIEYKKIGLRLNVSPTIDYFNNVDMMIKIESSSVAGEGVGGAPIIDTAQLDTAVNVGSGVSIALGGLIGQKDMRTMSTAPPPGGGASIINKADMEFRENFEILIFVTPTILEGADDAVKDIEEKVEDSFKKYETENLKEEMQ